MCEQIQECFYLISSNNTIIRWYKLWFFWTDKMLPKFSLLTSGDSSTLLKSYPLEHNNLETQMTSHF